jgi:uncharacterized protein (TIGR02687 family)
MDISKINEQLKSFFQKENKPWEKRKIVFWYDAEKDYEESIDTLEVEGVNIVKYTGNNNFEIKYTIEYLKTDENFLIYSPIEKPLDSENWLLGLESYAEHLTVDPIDLLLKEFGLKKNMYKAFKKYKVFFNNKSRKDRLLNYQEVLDNERKLGVGVISALTGINTLSFDKALRQLFSEGIDEETNRYYEAIKKFGSVNHFWLLIENYFGYSEEKVSLEGLMYYLVINYVKSNLKVKIPNSWNEYLKESNNAIVFINQWINHKKDSEGFIDLLEKIDSSLNIKKYLDEWAIDDYIECEYTNKIDQKIIREISDILVQALGQFKEMLRWIDIRRNKLFYDEYKNYYDSLYYAIRFLKLKKEVGTIKEESPENFFKSYTEKYYKFDQYYRKFSFAYSLQENNEILNELNKMIERIYTNWYLESIGNKWSNVVEEFMDENFTFKNIIKQESFYDNYIKRFINSNERVYVIISDALRYEVADEVRDAIAIEIDGETKLESMSSILPSNTKYGMASLLPHERIETINSKVLVDGIDSMGSVNRLKILEKYAEGLSLVLKADDVLNMTQDSMRETCKGKKLVYIYHNEIDAAGDHAATENTVFNACNSTIDSLETIVKKLKNNISATNIFITADHGFIYKRSTLKESDKTSKALEAVTMKRRYAYGLSDKNFQGVHEIKLNHLEKNHKLFVPKGMNVLTKKGPGMNFVHGGVQLQEIVIPVISVHWKRNKEEYRSSKVEVEVIGNSRRITNKLFNIQLYQIEKISERVLPRKFKVYFVSDSGDVISDIVEYKADSTEDNRMTKLRFTLKDNVYKENEECYLVLDQDEKALEKYKKIPYEISLLITDDFGF